MRVGTGFDLHRLGADRPLRLGGVEISGAPGLVGHSDADCVLHAICDALLGAASLADIGEHFPDTDPAYEGADSADLTRHVLALISEAGYRVGNIDFTVMADAPKLSPYRQRMKERIAGLLEVPAGAVGVKFTTMEGLAPDRISCQAICLLEETA